MDEFVEGNIKLTISGKPVNLVLSVPKKSVKPTQMLPIYQAITNQFMDEGINTTIPEGDTVSCKKGCGACCKQPVPISESEIYQIAELVENLAEPKRSEVKEKFRVAVEFLTQKDWFERMSNFIDLPTIERQTIAMEYFGYGIECPFLEEGSCSIHPNRPIACREYLVTSPAENCSNPTGKTVKPLKLLFKTSDVVRKIGISGIIAKQSLPVLIQALDFAAKNENQLPEKTGESWLQDFFGELSKQFSQKNPNR